MADTYRLGDQLFRIINQEAVELLRSWLASAEAGELREVVLLGMEGDDNVWAATGTLSRTQRIGMLEAMKASWIRNVLEEETDP